LLLSLPVWALFLETLVIKGSSTGFSLRASAIIPLNHVDIISGEKSQNLTIFRAGCITVLSAWLNLCQDSFEVHAAVNASTLKPSIQIILAGIKMKAPAAKSWWNKNRDELKALTMWEEFAKKMKDRFIPVNWKMDTLTLFYGISQGSSSFMDYAAKLQKARNTLSSGGMGFTISDSVFKNHLLFFSHPILALHMYSIPFFVVLESLVS